MEDISKSNKKFYFCLSLNAFLKTPLLKKKHWGIRSYVCILSFILSQQEPFFSDYLLIIKYSDSSGSIYKYRDFFLLCYCFITPTGPFSVEFNGEQIIFQAMQTHQGESLLCLERLADVFASACESYCRLSYSWTFGLHFL